MKTKSITTYKRKRDSSDIKNPGDSGNIKSPTKLPVSAEISSPSSQPSSQSSQPSSQTSQTSQTSQPSSHASSQSSSQSSQLSSSQPSQSSQSSQSHQASPPSTPPKKLKKWDWWLVPKDNSQSTNAKTTPKKSTPTKKNDTPKKMEQMFLDLGQKNFDAKLCPECGMMYAPGVQEDSLMHTKFHAKHESIVNFPHWKSCRVVKEFASGGGVICVGQDDTTANQNKVAKVRKLMDKELGYVDVNNMNVEADQKIFLYITSKNKVVGCVVAEPIEQAFYVIIKDYSAKPEKDTKKDSERQISKPNDTDDSSPSTPTKSTSKTTPSSPSSIPPSPKLPLADADDLDLDKIMEIDITKNKKKPRENSKRSKSHNTKEITEDAPKKSNNAVTDTMLQKFSVSCSKEPQKAVCGISRVSIIEIWTARSHRRQGVATKLLDAVRANMIYGYTVPKELCAFSQPTADGKLFFEKYQKTREFLVYL